ncbi:hypothetical protein PBY51_024862 [Eleginops maclovinus]|uniref:Uncharacterized protein n=1 Tax=Eleginops maclovinus TaxID=56733 RepID=A0AAN8AS29_ELEMC|nr:hypothetical protein PBY51_024862 [Eleginops maclovinus]
MAAAHRDTDQSGLNGQNITSSAVHRSIRTLAVESFPSCFSASSPEVSHKTTHLESHFPAGSGSFTEYPPCGPNH